MKMVQHYQGELYKVLGVAKRKSNPKVRDVVYQDSQGTIWSEEYDEFYSTVEVDGKEVRKYKYLGDW